MGFWKIAVYRIKVTLCSVSYVILTIMVLTASIIVALYSEDELDKTNHKILAAVIDNDRTYLSGIIMKSLRDNPSLMLVKCNEEETMRLLSIGRLEAVCIIKKDFEKKIRMGDYEKLAEIYRMPVSTAAGVVGETVSSEIMSLWMQLHVEDSIIEEYKKLELIKSEEEKEKLKKRISEYGESIKQDTCIININYLKLVKGNMDVVEQTTQETSPFQRLVNFWSVFAFFISFTGSLWLMKEYKSGFIKRIMVSESGLFIYIAASTFGTAFLNWAVCIMSMTAVSVFSGLNKILFLYFAILTFIYILFACSAVMFISLLLRSVNRAFLFIPVITFANALFGGAIVNMAELGGRIKSICIMTPAYWFIQGMKGIRDVGGYSNMFFTAAGVFLIASILIIVINTGLIKWRR